MDILVIDDNVAIREAVKSMCIEEGFSVGTASNGVEALEILEKEEIPMIICDLVMPKMDGLSFCKAVRARAKKGDPFFFLLTGKITSQLNQPEAIEAGVDSFLYKPLSPALLKHQLKLAAKATNNKSH